MYISRANLSGCGISPGFQGGGLFYAAVHSSGARVPGDYDLVTLYLACTHNANTTTNIFVNNVNVANFNYVFTGDTGSRKILDKFQMPAGTILQISYSAGNSILGNGYVTEFRQSNTAPTLGSVAAYLGGWNPPNGNYGGHVLGYSARITAFDYTSRTFSIITATLDEDRINSCGAFNSTYGYFIGGVRTQGMRWTVSNNNNFNTNMKRLQFSNETVSNITQSLASAVSQATATMSSTDAYICGGDSAGTQVEKFTFSTETRAAYGATLPAQRTEIMNSSASDTANAGYIFGGYITSNTVVNSILKISHSSVAITTIGATIVGVNRATSAVQDSTYAFVKCGYNTAPNDTQFMQRFTFSSETFAAEYINIHPNVGHMGGRTSNSGKGFFFGIDFISGSDLGGITREYDMATGTMSFVPGGMPQISDQSYISTVSG